MGFTARLTAPSYSNKYYISTRNGGYNPCIRVSGNSCIPNCVGYANGRSRELSGNRAQMPACNAKQWWTSTSYARGSQPKLGAVMVWGGTKYGHVAVVEQIGANTITASMSAYGGARFYLRTFTKGAYNYNGLQFLGFIYNPYVSTATTSSKPVSSKTSVPVVNNAVYRLFNGSEHMYTASHNEAQSLANSGWKFEGKAWDISNSGTPVYRFYNGKRHFWTTDPKGESFGGKNEGVAFKTSGSTPVYRFVKGNEHFWTTDPNGESFGGKREGVAFKTGKPQPKPTPKPSTPAPKTPIKAIKASGKANSYNAKIAKTYTTTANLNVRDFGTTKSKSLGVLPKGTKFTCYGYYTGDFYYGIATANGITYTGFAHKAYLK